MHKRATALFSAQAIAPPALPDTKKEGYQDSSGEQHGPLSPWEHPLKGQDVQGLGAHKNVTAVFWGTALDKQLWTWLTILTGYRVAYVKERGKKQALKTYG